MKAAIIKAIYTATPVSLEVRNMLKAIAIADLSFEQTMTQEVLGRLYDEALKCNVTADVKVFIRKATTAWQRDIAVAITESEPVSEVIVEKSVETVVEAPVVTQTLFGSDELDDDDDFCAIPEPTPAPVVVAKKTIPAPKKPAVSANVPFDMDFIKKRIAEQDAERRDNMVSDVISTIIRVKYRDRNQTNKVFVSKHMLRSFVAKTVAGRAVAHTYVRNGVKQLEQYQFTDEQNKTIDEAVAKVVKEGRFVQLSSGYVIPVETMVKYGRDAYETIKYLNKNDSHVFYVINLKADEVVINDNGNESAQPLSDEIIRRINSVGRFTLM